MARRFVLAREEPSREEPRFTIDYRAALNDAQFAAATAGSGPTLIVAGAGTGKTRTLVYRVAYLIESGVAPEHILLLTFTRRAAREMLGRASQLLDGRCERVRGGTFHAMCLQILRRHAPKLGYPTEFTILDASDSADVLDLIRSEAGLDRTEKRFPKKNTLQAVISAARSREQTIEDVLSTSYPQFVDQITPIEDLARRYDRYKRDNALMDYDDLLSLVVELCERRDDARRAIADKNAHVLVDEYQDTNRVQARLVELLSSEHGNVTVVGDDAQSIYGFRGADHRNILNFPRSFEGAHIHKLQHNYRSTQPILNLANAVLRQTTERFEKDLFTTVEGGDKPALVEAMDSRWQSRFVCQMIVQLREEGVPLRRCAVLFRSSYNAFDLETELGKRRIPYVKYGGIRLSEAAHIRDVVAHLRVAENPGDVVSWMRVLKLVEGIGDKTARKILANLSPDRSAPFVDRQARYTSDLGALLNLITTLSSDVRPPADELALVMAYYQPILERRYSEDFPKRLQEMEIFTDVAQGYASRGELLEALALDPIDLAARDVDATYKEESPLVLSTIHSAKGLEFDSVFLIDALDGVIPSQYAVGSQSDLDAEVRLLYVALTRAEQRLFVCFPMTHFRRGSGDYLARLSRFLEGEPKASMERWILEEASEPGPASLEAGEQQRTLPPARGTSDGLPF